MSFQNAEIEVSLEAIKELEKRISDKKSSLKELTQANKILSSKISDKAVELDSIENSYNHQDVATKINERKTRYMELQSECKMKKKYLESIESQVHSYTVHIAEKEKDINSLQYQRDRLRHESKSGNSQVKSQIAELEISAEILRSRIDNYERLNTEMSEDDSRIAVDIINLMKEKMKNLKGIPEAEVQNRLETIREQIMEKEQRITELTLEYQDKKYKLTQELRRQKETLTRELREKYDQANRESRAHIDELKKSLKNKLEDSRSKEQKLSVESNDIGECRKLLMVRTYSEPESYFLTDSLRGRAYKKLDISIP
jgi:chromosome segregation ATPase